MTARVNQRAENITPFHVMRLLARAKELEAQGRDIVHMEIGEPDFPTPAPIVKAAQQAIATDAMHYTAATGLPLLQQRIAEFYHSRYGVQVTPQRIVITPGASGALLLALAAVLDVDQEILLTDPGYPCNLNMVSFLGSRARRIAVGPQTNYQLTAAHIVQHWSAETRAVLLASPSNPTGTIISEQELSQIAAVVSARQGELVVDEIYHGLVYAQPPASVLNVTDQAFVINSFSKYFGMTGWRLGWMVVPDHYRDVIERLAQNIYLAASSPAQHAALVAFEPATLNILEQRRVQFQQRRDFLVPALRALGFEIAVEPQGAFYLYCACGRFTQNSLAFCEDILEQTGVACTPGIDFGTHHANTHVRFAYTTGLEKLQDGIDRLQQYLSGR
jgi:aspartate/methionine/tyrosine aminotransferase